MTLKSNLTMIFTSYVVNDDGIMLHFMCPDPGAGEVSDYYVLITDADVTGSATVQTLAALVKTKLQRQLRGTNLAAKLDALIGQSIVNV